MDDIIPNIGGTFSRCKVVMQELEVEHDEIKENLTIENNKYTTERIIRMFGEIWPLYRVVKGISIAAPGSNEVKFGTVFLASNVPEQTNTSLCKIISQHYSVVFIDNNARLAAYSEWRRTAEIGHENLPYFTISMDIGCGIIYYGIILKGSIGIAIELGYITIAEKEPLYISGHRSHSEALSSVNSIRIYYLEKTPGIEDPHQISAEVISDYASRRDHLAINAFLCEGYYFSTGKANYFQNLYPTCVIQCGGVSKCAHLFINAFMESLEKYVLSKNYYQNLTVPIALVQN